MMEEQMLEINKKIKQIQGVINKRKEKFNEWNLDYRKVLQDKPDKTFYMSKTCGTKVPFKSLGSSQYKNISKQLKQKAQKSRSKVRMFYNELKDLDELVKQKNKIRLLILEKKQSQDKQNALRNEQSHKNAGEGQKLVGNQSYCKVYRSVKQRNNPFANIKIDKFIQLSQQAKSLDQNLGTKMMKQLGAGLQNTPLGLSIKKDEKKEELLNKKEKKEKSQRSNFCKTSFGKKFVQAFNKNEKIFGIAYQPRNIFEDRIKKIIKYHGQFWNHQFSLQ